MDCQPLLQRRQACYQKQGLEIDDHHDADLYKKGSSHSVAKFSKKQKCLASTLAAKRCLAFQHCELQALHYYGTPHDSNGPKSLCASFDEGYCFGNPQVMNVDNDGRRGRSDEERELVFAHHQKAKRRIVNNRNKFRACQDISERMHQCLRKVFE